jgi:hypothetical protein
MLLYTGWTTCIASSCCFFLFLLDTKRRVVWHNLKFDFHRLDALKPLAVKLGRLGYGEICSVEPRACTSNQHPHVNLSSRQSRLETRCHSHTTNVALNCTCLQQTRPKCFETVGRETVARRSAMQGCLQRSARAPATLIGWLKLSNGKLGTYDGVCGTCLSVVLVTVRYVLYI